MNISRRLALVCLCVIPVLTDCRGEDLFRDQVAPIFQRRCVGCHNDARRQGDFSLQRSETALADGYIEPGDAESSHLLEMIRVRQGRAAMPKDADPLTDEETAAIRRWIDAGAPWPEGLELKESKVENFDWWSYRPLGKPSIPAVQDPWIRTPVDAFLLEAMRSRGLRPAPPADRRTLIRRVTFDLIGLPPTPEEVAAFVQDESPDAYQRVVDRLLDSPHYGERWARHWLDVVKYADTCGYDKDKLRPHAWPYRDYVIRSFNEDKPYGRFVQEQIAGDVLFPDDPAAIVALGFIAAGPWDFIGHVEVPESKIDGKVARNLDRDDMVSNAFNAFCSVTVQCARCHHHKFDPITQENYYALQAVFAAVDRANRPFDANPHVAQERRRLAGERGNVVRQLEELEREIAADAGPRLAELNERIKTLQAGTKVRKSAAFGYHSAIADSPDVPKWVQVTLPEPADLREIQLLACHDEFGGIGAGFGFPRRFRLEASEDGRQWTTLADRTDRDVDNPGLAPTVFPVQAAGVRHLRVVATRLAERKQDYILALAELTASDATGANLAQGAEVTALDSIEAPVRWGKQNLTDGQWPVGASEEDRQELAASLSERQRLLARVETAERLERRRQFTAAREHLDAQLQALPAPQLVYAAATQFEPQGNFRPTGGSPRAIHVLDRGDVQQPRDQASPGVLPLAADSAWRLPESMAEGERRAALARWLTRPDHPLVWRSIVNRIWQHHFGQGLVATPNDFGRMGAEPTHPELLDWLAVVFRDQGQSFKQLHRLLVTSSAYQQDSTGRPENAVVDGSNQYLWRMNRRRLSAEEIRDAILAASGALDRAMGGPGYYLFELERTEHSPHYQYHKFDPSDPATHRRSIYRFVVRSQPDPWMTTLDCADSSQSTPRRNETLTSLQALSLLNNRFNLVMAERFAERLRAEGEDDAQRIDLAYQHVLQRSPDDAERRELTAYLRDHGLANLCRFLFNLNEFVFVD